MKRLRGLVAAAFTPMQADGSLDPKRVPDIVAHLLGQPLSGIFVGGSTGEGPSLTAAERVEIAEAYVRAVDGKLPVIVHVGHNCMTEAAELAAHAQTIGADAVAMAPPSYYPGHGLGWVVDCLGEVGTNAPDLPLYYYHIPRLTGVDLDVAHLLEIAGEWLPTLAGVKYSDPSFDHLQRCIVEHGERYDLLFGIDEMLLAGIAAGAHGAVGSTYCFMGNIYAAIIGAFESGEMEIARALQARATDWVHTITEYAPVPALKATMGLAGVDCGPPRLPLKPLDAEDLGELEGELRAQGFFDDFSLETRT